MKEKEEKRIIDYPLLVSSLVLVAIGLVSIYSASSLISMHRYGDSFLFLKHQVITVVVGIVLLSIVYRIPYRVYRKMTYPILLLGIVGLVLVFIPGVGRRINGASRWIHLGFFSMQPSEFGKLGLLIYLSYSLEKKAPQIKKFSIGYVPHVLIGILLASLVLLEPDLGTCLIYLALVFVLLFVAGVRIVYLVGTFACGVPILYFLIRYVPYRLERMLGFLDPWRDPLNRGYHLIHSLLAISSGGFWGVGLGNGHQKLFYLPEPHTDFILAVMGEELGLVGIAIVIILFGILLWRGLRIARYAPDLFGTYLAFGIITLICLEAVINMCVVVGLLPTKGLPLPFVSYGGSSLIMNIIGIGIVMNIGSYRGMI